MSGDGQLEALFALARRVIAATRPDPWRQLGKVTEESGEVADALGEAEQPGTLAARQDAMAHAGVEAADTVLAALGLLVCLTGNDAERVLAERLAVVSERWADSC